MPRDQALLDRVRVFNKRVTNKLLIHLAGKKHSPFAILTHTGRKSGKLYRIPIIAEPVPGGFVIAMTYGKKVDWYANVVARRACSLRWKEHEYRLARPELVPVAVGMGAFPRLLRAALTHAGIEYFLKLDIEQ